MSNAVRDLLRSFESLSEIDKQEAVVEVVRRTPDSMMGDLSNEGLVAAAESLFAALDMEEAAHADAESR